jgi:hypothetical protein
MQVEDYYSLKTCPICHEKDSGDSKVKSEKRKRNHSSVELVENLKFTEPIPEFLQSFTKYQAYWRRFDKEVTFEDCIKELNEHKKREIQKQTDTQIAKTKGEFTAKKRFLMKFLRFDVFEPSNREQCTTFRLQKLGLFHEDENRMTEHLETCEGCQDWLYNLMNDFLDSEDGLIIHLAYASDFKNEEKFQQVKNKCPHHGVKGEVITVDEKLKKITVVCNPNSIPMKKQFEFYEDRFADCCFNCGSSLIDGKCPNCGTRPYEN